MRVRAYSYRRLEDQTKQLIEDSIGETTSDGKPICASGLIEAKGPTWPSMKSRMKGLATDTKAKNY